MSWKLSMVPNVSRERVSYGITTKVEVTTTTIGVNRSPKRERIFLQKIKFQKVGFLREKFCWEVSKSEICSKKSRASKLLREIQKSVPKKQFGQIVGLGRT
jgi:hypothetical protein